MSGEVTSYDLVGKQEDVSDVISNISPMATPFQASIGDTTCNNTVFDWLEDVIRDPRVNKKTEGFTAANTARVQPSLRENVTQIMEDTYEIFGTSNAVKLYGRAKASAYEFVKASKGLKRDFEYAAVGTAQALVKPTDNGTARQFAGVQAQIDTSVIKKTGASDGSAPLTEAKLLDALEASYGTGSEPNVIMVTPSNSRVVADFAKASGRYRTLQSGGKDKAIVNVVDLYVSPYGEQKVVLNRWLKAGDTLIYDPEMWEKVTLRAWSRTPLAKVGDSDRTMIVGEFSLKHKNWKASAMVREIA